MTIAKTSDDDFDIEDSERIQPEASRGKAGNAAHGGDQAGPNAADGGRTIAPQKGNPRSEDKAAG